MSRTSAALPGAWGCSLLMQAAQHLLCAIVIKINAFPAATDPSREMNVLLLSCILPFAQAAFVCVCVLRKGMQRDNGKGCRSTDEDTRKIKQSFSPFLQALAGDAGHQGWLFPPAPAFACAKSRKSQLTWQVPLP